MWRVELFGEEHDGRFGFGFDEARGLDPVALDHDRRDAFDPVLFDSRTGLRPVVGPLDAAEVPNERIEVHAVERTDDGTKTGPGVEEHGIERIPTIVIERNGIEAARFVETEPEPAIVFLAEQLDAPQTPT